MEGRWQSLRIGDRVRYIRIPGQSVPGYYMHEDTRRLFERLIEERVVITIASIDDFGTPWARCFVDEADASFEELAIVDADDTWELVSEGHTP
jgi:hypothetical protein